MSTDPMCTRLLPPTPLPPNPYSSITHPSWHAAFKACISLEHAVTLADLRPGLVDTAREGGEDLMLQTSPQVAGRTLGHALIHAPNDVSRDCVAREVNSCEEDPELLAGLAHVFVFGLTQIFLNPAGRTPMEESPRFLSPSEALRQLDRDGDQRASVLPPGVTPKRLTKKLLLRDRRRCVFTGKWDIQYSLDPSSLRLDPAALQQPGQGGASLEVMHIVSQPLSRPCFEAVGGTTQRAQNKLQWASFPATILARLAGVDVRDVLPDLDIHHPANALMADTALHTAFKKLWLWLTPSSGDQANAIADTYDAHFQYPFLTSLVGHSRRICLRHDTTSDGADVPPPSRILLELHAWCAKVAHLSGAAEVLERFYGENGVLDEWSRSI